MESLRDILENLYDQHRNRFYHCALSVTGNSPAAEDAVHTAFKSALRLKSVPINPEAYLFRSVRNAAIDILRKQSRLVPLSTEEMFETPSSEDNALDRKEFLEAFTNALDTLSPDERETILQHLMTHLSFREIAELRDRPIGTVTSWYRRGLKKLQSKLKHEYGTA
ncbi:MAG: RNA polymerase sigma factor [Verrucomicrobiota bacterium]